MLGSRTWLKGEVEAAEAAFGRANARWHGERRLCAEAEARCERLTAEADRLRAAFESAWAERNEARGRAANLERRLAIAQRALTRLSHNDEMAGMGQRDDDPEAIARCRYARRALDEVETAQES